MSGYSSSSSSEGIGLVGVLQIVFIVLKLCHLIDWSWWWVLSPSWIWLIVVIAIVIWAHIDLHMW